MNKLDDIIFKTEKVVTAFFLASIATLVFVAAVMRKFGYPLNWAQDISLLFFAWLTFVGGDLLMRSGRLIFIDILYNVLPSRVKKVFNILFGLAMMYFLIVLIWYGFKLVMQSWTRLFNTLKLSYAWCTLCVPVGSLLMLSTVIKNLIKDIKTPAEV
ncbi:TRAP transporter small permease [Sphaerochaeta sp. PS]|uniref:TRAP transporter small permease n=1 Tax=Sphaerochaeta sp. PS TaxID=3076336 RepID=UPI0028A56220|nr:TRAP transporter small permease [Sphaerochaeta sp. PS]MDT4762216.1 TRAP transporter small permease [Sphaerochaeta sp. PS]